MSFSPLTSFVVGRLFGLPWFVLALAGLGGFMTVCAPSFAATKPAAASAMQPAQIDQHDEFDRAGMIERLPGSSSDSRRVEVLVFKTVGDVEIKARVEVPRGKGPFPVVLYVHGGGWASAMGQGVPSSFDLLSAHFAERGVAGVQIFYRGKQTATIWQTIADVFDGIAWVKQSAGQYHFDASRLVLLGSSAGGHLVTLLGPMEPACAGIVSISGVYDIPRLFQEWEAQHAGENRRTDPMKANHPGGSWYWGDAANLVRVSPQAQLGAAMPPMLLVHGEKDLTVPHDYAESFVKAVRAQGGAIELVLFAGAPHRFFNVPRSPYYAASTAAIDRFVLKALGVGPAAPEKGATR